MFFLYSISMPALADTREQERVQIEEYIAQMAEGNSEAVASLYEQTKSAVYGFALSILRNVHDAEDVLQDTYIQIFRAADRYRCNRNPMPWIFTITKNLAYMKLRDKNRVHTVAEEEWQNILPEMPSLTPEDKLVLQSAMEVLSDQERQIVMLHAVGAFKHREISDLLGIPLSTVLSKYHRAVKKLKMKLQEDESK